MRLGWQLQIVVTVFESKIKSCSCYTGGSSGIRPYGLKRNAGGCCRAVNRAVEALKSMSEDFRQALEKLKTMEKEHKGVVHQVGERREKESKLILERDKARESVKKSLEKVSQMKSKQLARDSQAARLTTVKPKKFSGSGNDTDFQAFLDQFEVCAKVNNWNEEEKPNQLILCMKEKAHVVMSQLLSEDKNSYECMVKALHKEIGIRQVPEAAKATLKARRRKVGELC